MRESALKPSMLGAGGSGAGSDGNIELSELGEGAALNPMFAKQVRWGVGLAGESLHLVSLGGRTVEVELIVLVRLACVCHAGRSDA